ncbi:Seryl-tRNA synthetase [Desulfurella amilsii]|uniref:Serine--tRNA ligase n=1 Tax=Desulfurella amilsii TaxID=1562698 RepID=A0A1X4XWT1_9BACT|nr:serine--tRNA ligase [Desulfurella amilsii]OSS41974.1 Seryl-tRNA synthetase [Desulfurella amilsii]
MLDVNILRQNVQLIEDTLKRRNNTNIDLNRLIQLDEEIRKIKAKIDSLLHTRKIISKEIGSIKAKKGDSKELESKTKELSVQIGNLDDNLLKKQDEFLSIWLLMPNLVDSSVVYGKDESENVEIRRVGEPKAYEFAIKAHDEIAKSLDILDFDRAARVSGSRFVYYKSQGARLERALINFMLDLHTKNGYTEMFVPYIVNEDSLIGTGQFPKFREEAYNVEEQFLIPTAEVPLVNFHREEILDESMLPLKYVAYSACFRKEAGSYGKDVRGIIRQHQFNKVELVQFTKPQDSFDALEDLINQAELVLKELGLPYRVVMLCSGDLGFASVKTYDLEVWFPSQKRYREISSCSNTLDFQARRAKIKVKSSKTNYFPHTLNGSGVAVGRCFAAILENYQTRDGNVKIPEKLVPYYGSEWLI